MNQEVNQTPRPDLESDEYIEDTEAYRDCDKEIAGNNLLRMIAEKGCPALILRSMRRRRPHVLAYGSWGDPNLQFQQEFISDPLFTPGRVSIAMRRINRLNSIGTAGLPAGLDFHRQNRRKAVRCQLISVAGFTMTKASRQSNKRASRDKTKRSAAVVALAFFSRS